MQTNSVVAHAAREKRLELLRVRVGVHQGEVVERRGHGEQMADIYSIQVSTAARIADLGCGG